MTHTGSAIAAHVSVGDVIDKKYLVQELIGQGGMGQVLGATHLELQQKVALKFMSPAIMEIPGAVARFTREARAVAKLRSKHVCRVLDIGETEEGAKYIVIEYLEGQDLSEVLMIREKLPLGEAIEYITQACDALGEAHDLDIVHRDIKPANLFIDETRDGQRVLKVLDFGISKNLSNDPDMIVTATNALMGSPVYMSPEQLLNPKAVDTRADIWSLGIVLHELLAGFPPFRGATLPEVIALIVNDARPPSMAIADCIPPELRQIIAKCIERDPVKRYRTTEQLADALSKVRPELAGVGRKDRALATKSETTAQRDLPWKWIGVVGAAGLLMAALLLLPGSDGKDSATDPVSVPAPGAAGSESGIGDRMVRPVVSPSDTVNPNNTEDEPRAVNLVDDVDAGTGTQAAAPVPPEPASKRGSNKARNDRRGGKREKKSKKADLMDPNAGSRGRRDPGDDDVMDPEL